MAPTRTPKLTPRRSEAGKRTEPQRGTGSTQISNETRRTRCTRRRIPTSPHSTATATHRSMRANTASARLRRLSWRCRSCRCRATRSADRPTCAVPDAGRLRQLSQRQRPSRRQQPSTNNVEASAGYSLRAPARRPRQQDPCSDMGGCNGWFPAGSSSYPCLDEGKADGLQETLNRWFARQNPYGEQRWIGTYDCQGRRTSARKDEHS